MKNLLQLFLIVLMMFMLTVVSFAASLLNKYEIPVITSPQQQQTAISYELAFADAPGIGVPPTRSQAMVFTPPATGSAFAATWYYGLKSKTTATVVQATFGHLTNILGHKNWSLDVSAFTGTVLKSQALIGGFTVGKSIPVAAQLNLVGGLSVAIANGIPFDYGLTAGLSYQF